MSSVNLVPGVPRRLAYGSCVRTDLKLLEVDEAVLQEILSVGGCIKGGLDEEAVFCTKTQTFAIKHVETTNTLLLVAPVDQEQENQQPNCPTANPVTRPPHLEAGASDHSGKDSQGGAGARVVVGARAGAHLELAPTAPRLACLDAALQVACLRDCDDAALAAPDCSGAGSLELMELDSEREQDAGAGEAAGLTFEELLQAVQASEAELEAALAQQQALEVGGRWRSVDAELRGTLLELLLLTAVQQDWPHAAIPGAAAAAALAADGCDERLTAHCLAVFGRQAGARADLWAIDDSKVCQHYARQLLQQRQAWPAAEFMAAWQAAVPEGVEADVGMLCGEVLQEAAGGEERIKWFPAAALPTEPAARFAALFRERPRWEAKDLEPYLQGLQVPGESTEAMILRYTRATQARAGDPIVYSARF